MVVDWHRATNGSESEGDWWEVGANSGEMKGRCCGNAEAGENGVTCWSFNEYCSRNVCVDNSSCSGTLLEFEEADWEQLQMGLGDIVFSWYNSDALSCEENNKLDFYVI